MARLRVLLTGGSGFIGRNLLESALAERVALVAPDRGTLDVADTDSVDRYFRRERFDAVVHAAGKPGHRNAKDPSALFYTNTRMYHNLARHAGEVGRLVVLGSGAAYDLEHYRPRMREEYFGTHIPRDEHGFCKYVCGLHALASANIYDLRLFGVFGPYEDYAIRFISNMAAKAALGLPLTMRRDRRFDYLWAPDLGEILARFLDPAFAPRHHDYNVTPDETVSLRDLAGRVRALSGKDLPIVVAEPGEGPEYSGDNARLRAELPGLRFTPLSAALPRLVAWYAERSAELRREDLLHDK